MADTESIRDMDEADSTLGPYYHPAQKVAEEITALLDPERFEKVIKKCGDELYKHLLDTTMAYLQSDAESNVQGHMWRFVDDAVQALLSGEEWAMKRYALGDRYDCGRVRATVAKYVPEELQDARVADLEEQLAGLQRDLRFFRDR